MMAPDRHAWWEYVAREAHQVGVDDVHRNLNIRVLGAIQVLDRPACRLRSSPGVGQLRRQARRIGGSCGGQHQPLSKTERWAEAKDGSEWDRCRRNSDTRLDEKNVAEWEGHHPALPSLLESKVAVARLFARKNDGGSERCVVAD